MSKKINVAVLGASGLVGQTLIEILAERDLPIGQLFPLASPRSAGKTVSFRGESIPIQAVADFDWRQANYGLFSPGGSVSEQYAPIAAAAGCTVIDNSSAFRYHDDVPLVVPEVNPEALRERPRGIIANPNCSTIQMVVALKPLRDAFGLKRVNVCTYQAVSGSGRNGIQALASESAALESSSLAQTLTEDSPYPVPIAGNVIPHIDSFQANGYTREEMKMVWETQKIFADSTIAVNPTAVRVPVTTGHSEAIHIETERDVDLATALAALAAAPGVHLLDGVADTAASTTNTSLYPTALTHAVGSDPVWVGRVRVDPSNPKGINLWVVADNVRKGAALNAVQILECLVS